MNLNWVSISFRSSGTIISGLFLIFQTFKDACWSLLLYQKEPERGASSKKENNDYGMSPDVRVVGQIVKQAEGSN